MLQPPRRTVTVGEAVEELFPPSVLAAEATVQTPDGRNETVPLVAETNATRFRFANTDQSGLYRVSYGSPRRELAFAVNVPTSGPNGGESDLRRLSADELLSMTPEGDVQIVSSLGAVRRMPKRSVTDADIPGATMPTVAVPHGPGLARWMLLVVFGLLVAEGILAWRFGSARSGPAPAVEPTTSGVGPRWATRRIRRRPPGRDPRRRGRGSARARGLDRRRPRISADDRPPIGRSGVRRARGGSR